jgi:hypothetical protein
MRNPIFLTLAVALAAGCIDQKQDAPAPAAPAPAPAIPPEPPRSAMAISPTTGYTVVGAASNKCVQYVAGTPEGARTEIRTCNGSKAQLFNLRPVPGGYYEIVSAQGTNECLDVPAFEQDDGAPVQQWTCNGGANQHWIVADAGPDAIRLVAQHSGKVLAINGENTGDGSLLGQWAWKAGSNQRFKLLAAGAKPGEAKGGSGGHGGTDGQSGMDGKPAKGGKAAKAAKTKAAKAPAATP